MSAMVKLDVSGIVYGTVSTLLDSCIQIMVKNWMLNLESFNCLPANLKDKCIYLMSKRGWLSDSNIGKAGKMFQEAVAEMLHDRVKVLDLADCDIGDEGIASICLCKQLRKIDLNAIKESRTNISSQAIRNLALSCKNLQTVYLRRCLNLTDEAVISISRSCPQLRLLNLGGCQNITDDSLQALGENSKFLKSVNVSNTQITDSGVISLVSGQCAKCLTITAEGINKGESNRRIHLLTEFYSMQLANMQQDEAVEAVLQFCPLINILLFHGCPKVTEQSRQALEELTISRQSPMRQVTWTIY